MPSPSASDSQVDVLIIGAGPAGLMAANALANAKVNVRIVDKRSAKVTAGQADGISPRTIEVFQSYGIGDQLLKEGCQVHMAAFYNSNSTGGIKHTGRAPDVTAPSARYPFQVWQFVCYDRRAYTNSALRARHERNVETSPRRQSMSLLSTYESERHNDSLPLSFVLLRQEFQDLQDRLTQSLRDILKHFESSVLHQDSTRGDKPESRPPQSQTLPPSRNVAVDTPAGAPIMAPASRFGPLTRFWMKITAAAQRTHKLPRKNINEHAQFPDSHNEIEQSQGDAGENPSESRQVNNPRPRKRRWHRERRNNEVGMIAPAPGYNQRKSIGTILKIPL
ncbi:FAD binding domain-containing protein [Hygrophoropsis aurantiaca]|uniref:FAD binding domain-containing protein n=1 Tax=Hygrophoropsis aurantiaca TaxID=72124 RepID=A0ACB8ABH7_9AGAM|nr:FAD binding domain-containing protein [Hygrophoropsis aurantiaca]